MNIHHSEISEDNTEDKAMTQISIDGKRKQNKTTGTKTASKVKALDTGTT